MISRLFSYANYQLVLFVGGGGALALVLWLTGAQPARVSPDVFELATRLDPAYAQGHRVLASELARAGRNIEALDHLRAARAADPWDGTLCFPLGDAARRTGSMQEARDALACAVKYEPRSAEAQESYGAVLLQLGEAKPAVSAMEAALTLAPERNELRKDLGTALARSGDLPGAARVFAEAVRRAPDDGWTVFNLGLVLRKQGKLDFGADLNFFFAYYAPFSITVPVCVLWTFHITDKFSAYAKVGIALKIHPGYVFPIFPDGVGVVGANFMFSKSFGVRAEAGYPGLKVGILLAF